MNSIKVEDGSNVNADEPMSITIELLEKKQAVKRRQRPKPQLVTLIEDEFIDLKTIGKKVAAKMTLQSDPTTPQSEWTEDNFNQKKPTRKRKSQTTNQCESAEGKPAKVKRVGRNKNEYVIFNDLYKKQFLNHLQTNGCGLRSCNEAFDIIRVNPASTLEFLNKRIELAQKYVHEECNSFCFDNISKWLEHFKQTGLDELCHFEAASAMMLIPRNEELPEPENLEGIDLKQIYKFIGNALYGHPQPELNKQSRSFLIEEFKKLIELANNEQGDRDANNMKMLLEARGKCSVLPQDEEDLPYLSLDPLQLDFTIKETLDLD